MRRNVPLKPGKPLQRYKGLNKMPPTGPKVYKQPQPEQVTV